MILVPVILAGQYLNISAFIPKIVINAVNVVVVIPSPPVRVVIVIPAKQAEEAKAYREHLLPVLGVVFQL